MPPFFETAWSNQAETFNMQFGRTFGIALITKPVSTCGSEPFLDRTLVPGVPLPMFTGGGSHAPLSNRPDPGTRGLLLRRLPKGTDRYACSRRACYPRRRCCDT